MLFVMWIVVGIVVGEFYICVLFDDDMIYCWGNDFDG